MPRSSSDDGQEQEDPYQWLTAALAAQTGVQGGGGDGDDSEEGWDDATGGVLSRVFQACEEDDAASLGELLQQLPGGAINTAGPDGDSALHLGARLLLLPLACF